SFMTAAEATAITTDKVPEAIRQDDHSCKYKSNPDDGMVVEVYQTGGQIQMNAQKNAAGLLQGMGAAVADKGGAGADTAELLKKDGTAAPKLGDEAMWGMNSLLAVRKGDAYVSVTPPIMHDPASHSGYPLVKEAEKRAIAQKAMETILARMGG
ncbi:MAG: hypothetical protein INR70_42675, partial [Parafilimonas terrae]|nr:hypothetical protein [Parafilimonas terrae]